jgi:hypothetical protein
MMILRSAVALLGVLLVSRVLAAAAPLPFYHDLYTFRSEQGATAVVAAVAVPVGGLQRERINDGVRYRFDVRFVLADTVERVVSRSLDSVYVSMPEALPSQHLLHTYVEIHAPPSEATVQRVVVTDATRPGVGQLYQSPFTIPDYSGTDLMLSDIAFGLPGATSGWTRRGVTLALLPTSQFPESDFDVYYEIYNLPAGSPYETEISIQPIDDSEDEGAAVRTRFNDTAVTGSDGIVGELRRVESSLETGRYEVTVTVREAGTGRVAARTKSIEVRGWGRGMTLLPALSRGNEPGSR